MTITPKYDLFDTPLLNWGASMSSIRSAEKHESLDLSSETALAYDYTSGSTGCIVMYSFSNGKLQSAMALLSRSMYASAGYYLLERFQPVGIGDDTDVYFMDAMTREKAKTVGMLDYYTLNRTTYTSILFADITVLNNSTSRSVGNSQTIPDELKQSLSRLLK